MNEESERILAQRTIDAMRPKAGTIFIQGDASGMANGFAQPGTLQAQEAFQNFIVCTIRMYILRLF
jgi:transcription initiation factor TFIIF subunit beta